MLGRVYEPWPRSVNKKGRLDASLRVFIGLRTSSGRRLPLLLDRDLAGLCGVTTMVLNQALKRNRERFPWISRSGEPPSKTEEPLIPARDEAGLKQRFSKSWRGAQGHKTTPLNPSPVPGPEKVYLLPAFSLNWLVAWDRIKNGELVVTETISSCG